jgi:uncharacterized protein
MLAWRLFLATGETRFADLVERTAYNAVLPGLALDGAHFSYSNPLQRRSDGAEVTAGAAATRRPSWFACACCPPNLMRFLATVPDLVATTDGSDVALHQFAAGTVEATLASGERVRLSTATDYPWDGTITVVVDHAGELPWTLSLRQPAWAGGATVDVETAEGAGDEGGRTSVQPSAGDGTIEITRAWRSGDRVVVRLAMPARVTVPDPRIDAVRGTVALERGPLVYAIEDADLPAGASVDDVALVGSPSAVTPRAGDAILGGMTQLETEAVVEPRAARTWPYGNAGMAAPADGSRVIIRAVPYFAWGNREGRGMRVWLPRRQGVEPAGEDR